MTFEPNIVIYSRLRKMGPTNPLKKQPILKNREKAIRKSNDFEIMVHLQDRKMN